MKQANHGAIDNQQLISIIERIEKLNEDTAAIAADIKEIYSEAKSAGFDPKYIRQMKLGVLYFGLCICFATVYFKLWM